MTKHINRRWALALITATIFGTAGATIAAADADAAVRVQHAPNATDPPIED